MRIFPCFILLWVLGCSPPGEHAAEKPIAVTPHTHLAASKTAGEKMVAKSIQDIANYSWKPHHPDTTGYLCELQFKDEYVLYFFHGQCIFFFFTYTTYALEYQQVALEWTYKRDCLLDMSFLEQAHGVKRHPKHGDRFATYRLMNDTTLSVQYEFPEWVRKVNNIARDSLFPQRIYIKKENGQ